MDKSYRFKEDLFSNVLYRFMGRFQTQSRRASALGISQSSMSRLENGKREPTIEELVTICNKSGFSPADFFVVRSDYD